MVALVSNAIEPSAAPKPVANRNINVPQFPEFCDDRLSRWMFLKTAPNLAIQPHGIVSLTARRRSRAEVPEP